MPYDKLFLDSMSQAGNFERRYAKDWREAECDGGFKGIGFLHFEVDQKCAVEVWNDKVTGKKRWWFGFSFKTKADLVGFLKSTNLNVEQCFDESGFDNAWLMHIVKEKWKGESEWYLGIYSTRGKEREAIEVISTIAKGIDGPNYIGLNRKYGEGEGEDHRALKQYVFDNPGSIGLSGIKAKYLEYPFTHTGDRVDILFTLKGGIDVVVEIETNNALPGCHQAIKYKSLRSAERGLNLGNTSVKSYLVAWTVPQEAMDFCKKYGIKHYEIRL